MNYNIFHFFNNLSHQNPIIDWVITFCAIYFPYIVAGAAIVFIIYHKHGRGGEPVLQMAKAHIREFVILICSVLITWGLITLLKEIIAAPRPYLVFENFASLFPYGGHDSFPSGHAGLFAAIAGAISIFHKRAGAIFLIFAIIIGLARIAAGVHFPIDILSGLIIGFFGVQGVYRLLKK